MKFSIIITSLIFTISTKADNFIPISEMFANGDYEGVIENINRAQKDITVDEKIYLAGISAMRLQKYEQAIEYLKKIDPKKFEDSFYLIAQAYYSISSLKKSAAYFKKSLQTGYKEDSSLYYLGTIHKELGLYNDAKKYFTQIHNVSFPDLNLIQAAHHQVGLLYLDGYVKTKKLSKKVIKKKVIPKLEYAIRSAPKLELAKIIKRDIKYIRSHFLKEDISSPLKLYFDQYFNYNSNVIYQSVDPVDNNNSSSALFNSALGLSYRISSGESKKIENTTYFSVNHQYHLKSDDPNIARYDGYSLAFQNQVMFKKLPTPIWLNVGYRYQAMNNQLSGSLVFDNKSLTLSLGNQLKIFGINPSFEINYETVTNFTGQNDQNNISITSIIPYSFNQYLNFYIQGELKSSTFTNLEELSNYQLQGTLAHIMYLTKKDILTTRGTVSIIDTREMRDRRGYEILLAPQISYEMKFKNNFNVGFQYRYERKLSKDEESFAYEQHLAGFNIGYAYE